MPRATLLSESTNLLKLAIPVALSQGLTFIVTIATTIIVGQLGAYELSVATLSTTFTNVVASSVVMGLGEGMDTLCSQAYGAKAYSRVGRITQRAFAILFVTACISTLILCFSSYILRGLGQPEDVIQGAWGYSMLRIPGIFALVVQTVVSKFLVVQGDTFYFMHIAALVVVCMIPQTYAMVHWTSLGVYGGSLGISLSQIENALFFVIYAYFRTPEHTCFHGFQFKEMFSGWYAYLTIALPATVMLCCEWWAFEVVAIFAGMLPDPDLTLAIQGICLSICAAIFCTIPLGLGIATTTRVGYYLGAGDVSSAKLVLIAGIVSYLCIFTLGVGWMAIPSCYEIILNIYLHTSDAVEHEEALAVIRQVMPILVVGAIFDGLKELMNSGIRGSGRQHLGAAIGTAVYSISLVGAAAFAFGWGQTWVTGIAGLWTALAIGTFIQSILLGLVNLTTDWDKQAQKAEHRVSIDELRRHLMSEEDSHI